AASRPCSPGRVTAPRACSRPGSGPRVEGTGMTALLDKLFDRRRNTALAVEDTRAVHACASWLINYPDDDLIAKLPTIAELAGGLDPRVGVPLARSVEALSGDVIGLRSEEHTSELQSRFDLVCRLLLAKTKSCDQRVAHVA